MNARTAIAAVAFGVALAGAAFGVWSVIHAILTAPFLTQFIVGVGCAGTGGMATYLSMKGGQS